MKVLQHIFGEPVAGGINEVAEFVRFGDFGKGVNRKALDSYNNARGGEEKIGGENQVMNSGRYNRLVV